MSELPPEEDGAVIIPITALTREAAFRRFAEYVSRGDPMPEDLTEALGKIPERHPGLSGADERLADLVYDSDEDDEPLAGVRGSPGGTRRLTFEGDGVALEVELTLRGRRSLLCQVVPAQAAVLEIRGPSGATETLEDPDGTFHAAEVRSGPLSLRCRLARPGSPVLTTTWVRI